MIWLTTSQIGEMSRKRTNSAESSIARPVEKTTSSERISGSSSQLSIGRTPEISAKSSTTTRFSSRLKKDSSTIASGMTMRGNWILRTRFSRSKTLRTAPPVASPKNVNSTIEPSSCTP